MITRTTYKNQIPLDNSRTEYDFRWRRKSISNNHFAIQKRKTQRLRHDAIFKSTNLEVLKNQPIEENLTANIEQSELSRDMTIALSSLKPREERIVRQYFAIKVKKHTQLEIAKKLKLSSNRISNIIAKSLRKLAFKSNTYNPHDKTLYNANKTYSNRINPILKPHLTA